jgi:hypothetical protein
VEVGFDICGTNPKPLSWHSASSGRSRDITVQGEWLSHRGLPAHGVAAPLPQPLVAGSGALDLARMGEPAPSHDSNAVVVDIVRPSIRLD